jgi:hypothetical protein
MVRSLIAHLLEPRLRIPQTKTARISAPFRLHA